MRSALSHSQEEILASCERLMRTGSHSFFAASRILPARFRHAAAAVYAFCRVADDAVDEMPHGASIDVVMRYLHERLDAIYRGEPFAIDADIAFAGIAHEFGIPKEIPLALLEGFQWDAVERRYDTIEELHDYAARVAGTVGAMMTLVMGGRSAQTFARACELGAAMQLTNIARDVGEDARRGRIYLPIQWLREEAIDPEAFLANPQFTPALGRVVHRLLSTADQLYVRAETGIACLPRDCRPAIMAARLIYADIGRVIRQRRCDSVSYRAVVYRPRKWWLMGRAMIAYVLAPQRDFMLRPLASVQFLVAATPAGEQDAVQPDLLISTIGLLERLGHRDRSRRGSV
ncbi:MAG: phytoene/squalene synthase family protein [Burkholderiaceae bacterium]|nr:phytoene/squalene synthase family protein [Burkholderiaceae bacterium]